MIIPVQTLFFFRHALYAFLDRIIRPYLLYVTFKRELRVDEDDTDEEDYDEEVYAIRDNIKGVVFFPPVYVQRYAAVTDCLMEKKWEGQLEKVVELGYHDISFIKYLKEVPGIKRILGVDIEAVAQRCSLDLLCDDVTARQDNKLHITLFQGNAADPDYRLIGCDAVIAIEMIEHMLPHDLDRLIHTVFGFIKPRIAIFTTPNADFNELFIGLEKNGLRRMDHYFEWSRVQFNDWCANIVTRYPEYTVSCRGIGPGPDGTRHLGCCSQMALFESLNYHKQQDLNPNSLSLVADAPPKSFDIESWDNPERYTENTLSTFSFNPVPSTNIIFQEPSRLSIIMTQSMMSLASFTCIDKTSQCNIDLEIAKNFLMFDEFDEMRSTVLFPRKWEVEKMYNIGDVATRLNCTTMVVKKFSKLARSLMEKNKRMNAPSTTREIVNEIKSLSALLQVDKQSSEKNIWNNINWGYNAPYWNEYYKVVREYDYPLKMENEETMILDCVTDEINSLADVCRDPTKERLLIPIDRLMRAVAHITSDEDRVRDLLEWNGYVIEDKSVVYHRAPSTDLPDDDGLWTNDLAQFENNLNNVQSSSLSDNNPSEASSKSGLRRFINVKLHELRSLTATNADFDVEMDNVIHRLAKLALRVTKGEKSLQPLWMHRKLYELLSLTERALETRRLRFINNYVISDHKELTTPCLTELHKYKTNDDKIKEIESRYKCLIKESFAKETIKPKEGVTLTTENGAEAEKTDTRDYSNSNIISDPCCNNVNLNVVKEDITVIENSIKTDDSVRSKYKKRRPISSRKYCNAWHMYQTRIINHKKFRRLIKKRSKHLKFAKKAPRVRGYSKENTKKTYFCTVSMSKIGKFGQKLRDRHSWRSTSSSASKPIPTSLIKLCHPEMCTEKYVKNIWFAENADGVTTNPVKSGNCADAEESQIFSIVMDDADESLSLGAVAATDDNTDSKTFLKHSKSLKSSCYYPKDGSTEKIHDSVYFYDDSNVNEPSTSKGFRHKNIDVQCGPDVVSTQCSNDNCANLNDNKSSEISTSLYENNDSANISLSWNKMYAGIRIKDSLENAKNEKIKEHDVEIIDGSVDLISDIITDDLNKLNYDIILSESEPNAENISKTEVFNQSSVNPEETVLLTDPTTQNELDNKLERLICDGVQIHSFIDANNSHDIICQGNWQKHAKPKNTISSIQLNKKNKENIPLNKKMDKKRVSTIISKVASNHSITKRNGLMLKNMRIKGSNKTVTNTELKENSESIKVNHQDSSPDNVSVLKENQIRKNSKSTHKLNRKIPVLTPKTSSKNYQRSKVITKIKEINSQKSKHDLLDKTIKTPGIDQPDNLDCETSMTINSIIKDIFNKSEEIINLNTMQNKVEKSSENNVVVKCTKKKPASQIPKLISPRKSSAKSVSDKVNKIPCFRRSKTDINLKVANLEKHTVQNFTYNNTIIKKTDGVIKKSNIPKPILVKSNTDIDLKAPKEKILSLSFQDAVPIKDAVTIKDAITFSGRNIINTDHMASKNNKETKLIVHETFIGDEDYLVKYENKNFHSNESADQEKDFIQDENIFLDSFIVSPTEENINPLFVTTDSAEYTKELQKDKDKLLDPLITYSSLEGNICEQLNINESADQAKDCKVVDEGKFLNFIVTDPNLEDNNHVLQKNLKINMNEVQSDPSVIKSKIDEGIDILKQKLIQEITSNYYAGNPINNEENLCNNTIPKLSSIIRSKTGGKINLHSTNIETENIKTDVDTMKFNLIESNSKENAVTIMQENYSDQISNLQDNKLHLNNEVYSPIFHSETIIGQNLECEKPNFSMNHTAENLSFTKTHLTHTTVDEIPKDLLYLPLNEDCAKEANYIVFCNEITNDCSMNDKEEDSDTKVLQSTSSTVSTANSIITVKSLSSFKDKASTDDGSQESNSKKRLSESCLATSSPAKIKEKKNKSKQSCKQKPAECSKNQSPKHFLKGKDKNVFVCQLNSNSITVQSNNKTLKKVASVSNTKSDNSASTRKRSYESKGSIDVSNDTKFSSCDVAPKKARSGNSSVSKKRSMSRNSFILEKNDGQNPLSPRESKDPAGIINESTSLDLFTSAKTCVNPTSNQYASASNRASEEAFAAEITTALQNLIDSNIFQSDDAPTATDINSIKNPNLDTLPTNESDSKFGCVSTPTDTDGLSYRSITSMSVYSDAYLADNELNSLCTAKNLDAASFVELLEKTDQARLDRCTPTRGFHGFSSIAGPVIDVPDYCNLVDSETGSIAGVSRPRHGASEDVFGAAVSSDSFVSCLLDEDSVVPDWLFAIMTQHHEMNEGEPEMHVPDEHLDENMLDVNGNMMEAGLGLESGAGDGRGMHSQQDSSGQGTLDSSGASSGSHSDTILIDPSINYGLMDTIESTTESSATTLEYIDSDSMTIQGRHLTPMVASSSNDDDADVSSNATDGSYPPPPEPSP